MAFTVAQFIAHLQTLPQDLEVFAPEAYDNDTEWVEAGLPRVATLDPCEAYFWTEVDPQEVASSPEDFYGPKQAVVIG